MERIQLGNILLIFFFIFCSINAQLYRGAELRTLDPVLYGKFEVCYKPSQGEGLVSSFFISVPNPRDAEPKSSWSHRTERLRERAR